MLKIKEKNTIYFFNLFIFFVFPNEFDCCWIFHRGIYQSPCFHNKIFSFVWILILKCVVFFFLNFSQIVYNIDRVHVIIQEMFNSGFAMETSKEEALAPLRLLDAVKRWKKERKQKLKKKNSWEREREHKEN